MVDARVLKFIKNFEGAQSTFLNGCCYWFAFILRERFGGCIFYEAVEWNFVWGWRGELYDVTGCVSEKYLRDEGVHLIDWATYNVEDPSHYGRIARDCVLNEEIDE